MYVLLSIIILVNGLTGSKSEQQEVSVEQMLDAVQRIQDLSDRVQGSTQTRARVWIATWNCVGQWLAASLLQTNGDTFKCWGF
jgi:hypothetical protein